MTPPESTFPVDANTAEAESKPQIAASPTPESNSAAEPQATGVSLLTVLLVSLACSAFSGYAAWRLATRDQPAVSVVVLDAARIASARMDKAVDNSTMTEAEAAAAGKKFVQELNAEIDRYTQAGIVVINSSVTLNHPPAVDVTKDVAAALGVPLK